jgi:hypothetical protein
MIRPLSVLFVLAVALLALVAFAPDEAKKDEPKKDEPKKEEPPLSVQRSVECRWRKGPINFDGKINETAWENAVPIKDFVVFWQKRKAKTATTARLLWDDRYLYFSAEMEDSDLYAMVKEKNGQTWYDDVFELFLKPGGEGAKDRYYYEFQVNALNTQLELFFPSRGAGGYPRFAPVQRLGMESAVRLNGTLNDWSDTDTGWAVEGRIPWRGFEPSGGKPKPGDKWRFALCRYDYSSAFEQPELSSTAPLTAPNFHQYEDYGELVFVGQD